METTTTPKAIKRKLLRINDFESRADSILSGVRLCKNSHQQVMDRVNKDLLMEVHSVTYKNNPRYSHWMKGYVSALGHAINRTIMRDEVEFCYRIEGELYTTSKKDSGKKKLSILYGMNTPQSVFNDAEKGFFWFGTDKKYS